jgi:hypothetical protein
MTSANTEFDKLLSAIEQLPKAEKVQIWQRLDAELNRGEVSREFAQALEQIWSAYEHIPEAEIHSDIEQAVHEVRSQDATRRP